VILNNEKRSNHCIETLNAMPFMIKDDTMLELEVMLHGKNNAKLSTLTSIV
jgi:hypothetical protein